MSMPPLTHGACHREPWIKCFRHINLRECASLLAGAMCPFLGLDCSESNIGVGPSGDPAGGGISAGSKAAFTLN